MPVLQSTYGLKNGLFQRIWYSKEFLFFISFCLSVVIYIILLFCSRYIPLFISSLERYPINIRIRIVEHTEADQINIEEPISTTLSTKPIDFDKFIEDLLSPLPMAMEPPKVDTPSPEIAQQSTVESIPREVETTATEEVISRVEERILALEEGGYNEQIEVARRVVSPTREDILPPDQVPIFTMPDSAIARPLESRTSSFPSAVLPPSSDTQATPIVQEQPSPPVVLIPALEPTESPITIEQLLEEEIIQKPILDEVEEEKSKRPYEFIDDLLDLELKTYIPPDKSTGFFKLTVSVKKNATIPTIPKCVIFVVDCSASIGQRKLDITLRGVAEAIKQLREEDLFNIVLFRARNSYFANSLLPANPSNKDSAIRFLKDIPSIGQTDVFSSIQQLIQQPTVPEMPNILWICSDGKPTVGVRDARSIIASLTMENSGRYEIFTFGGGNTVDRYLLELLAYMNKGFSSITSNIEQISSRLPQVFRRIQHPVLTDVQMEFSNIPGGEIYPFVIPNFYKDIPVTVYGKFDPSNGKEFVFRLQGKSGNQKKEVIFRANLTEAESGDLDIAQKWAFHKSFYIIHKIIREGERAEWIQALSELREKYNIRTTYTP